MGNCIDRMAAKYKGILNAQEIADLMTVVKQAKERLRLKNVTDADMEKELLKNLNAMSERKKVEVKVKERNLYLQSAKIKNLVDYALCNYPPDQLGEALLARISGVNNKAFGSMLSVDSMQTSLSGEYLGRLISDLDGLQNGASRIFKTGKMDGEVADALWLMGVKDGKLSYKGSDEAWAVAEVLHRIQEFARKRYNRAGGFVGKDEHYITQQTHDFAKVNGAGQKKWVADIKDRLDWDRMEEVHGRSFLTDEQKADFLNGAWDNIVSGRLHFHDLPEQQQNSNLLRRNMPESVLGTEAKKFSRPRSLLFKSAQDWLKYNEVYGKGTMLETYVSALHSMAKSTALMQVFGPNPQMGLEQAFAHLQDHLHGNGEAAQKLKQKWTALDNTMMEVDGRADNPADPRLARISRNLRALEDSTKLGGAVISSFTDVVNAMYEARYNGMSAFTALGRSLTAIFNGRGNSEERAVLSAIGVYMDNICGDIAARAGGETPASKYISWMHRKFFQLNCLTLWTDTQRRSFGLALSNHLAEMAEHPHEKLSAELKNALGKYGIGKEEWDLLRQGAVNEVGHHKYLTPEALEKGKGGISDDTIAEYIRKTGKYDSKERSKFFDNFSDDIKAQFIADTRIELQDKLRTYFRDRISIAVLEPNARTKAILHQGTRAGTKMGELDRFAAQFKSFPVAFMHRVMGREIYDTANSKLGATRNCLQLALLMGLFGYGSNVVSDLLRGKSPAIPHNRKQFVEVASRAMTRGGGFGFLGDVIFGDFTYQSLADVGAGPLWGDVTKIATLYSRAKDPKRKSSLALESFKDAVSFVPGNNLWFVKGAAEYLFLHDLYERMSPGWMGRYKSRLRESGQRSLWSNQRW